MKEFPKCLNVKNKKNFPDIHYNRTLCYFRRDIYEHILREKENNYFDLERFNKKYVNDMSIMRRMVYVIIGELESFGWRCKLSFGDTGLFIYSTEKPPSSCWDGDFQVFIMRVINTYFLWKNCKYIIDITIIKLIRINNITMIVFND